MPETSAHNYARVIRRAYFSAAYEETAERVHGHNYVLEAYVDGPIQPDSGMVIGIAALKELLEGTTRKLDHRFLNRDIAAFKTAPPTAENVARFCYDDLASNFKNLPELKLFKVRLYETEDLWVDYGPGLARELK